jgi:signal recognition particle receptor subunit beta
MTTNKIVLLGRDKKRSNLLVSLFKEREIEIFVVENIKDAENLISAAELSLFLIDYKAIVIAARDELIELFKDARTTKFVIFDVPRDANRRLAFYRLGAYRILGTDYDIDDIYFFSLNLLSNEKPGMEEKESRFSGRLQDFNPAGLLNSFGKEKRSGVLRIQTPVSYGKIYFNNGHVYHASAGYLKDDDAVLYMLSWNNGRFMMTPLPRKEVKSQVKLSNIGLLLYGDQIREEVSGMVNELGGLSKELKIVNQGDLLHKQQDPDFKNFVEKMTDYRQIYDIIENSPYKMMKTLHQLVSLHKSKNLEIRESGEEFEDLYAEQIQESTGLVERLLTAEEVTQLRKNINATKINSGKLLILGTSTCGKTEFIKQFNQGSASSVRTDQELDFTTIELAEDFSLQVFGLALQEKLSQIIETLSEGLLGYVFLIDSKREDEFEYTNYVINNLISASAAPWTIAVSNLDKSKNKIPPKVKSTFILPKEHSMLICDVADKESVRSIVMSIKDTKK